MYYISDKMLHYMTRNGERSARLALLTARNEAVYPDRLSFYIDGQVWFAKMEGEYENLKQTQINNGINPYSNYLEIRKTSGQTITEYVNDTPVTYYPNVVYIGDIGYIQIEYWQYCLDPTENPPWYTCSINSIVFAPLMDANITINVISSNYDGTLNVVGSDAFNLNYRNYSTIFPIARIQSVGSPVQIWIDNQTAGVSVEIGLGVEQSAVYKTDRIYSTREFWQGN